MIAKKRVKNLPFPFPARLSNLHTQLWNNLIMAVIHYNRPSNLSWQLQPQRPTFCFCCADSSWQLRGTTADWGFMRESLSDDSRCEIESCDVMETRPLTDTMKKARVCLLQFTTIHIQDLCLWALTAHRWTLHQCHLVWGGGLYVCKWVHLSGSNGT